MMDVPFSHGGIQTADGMTPSRTITIEGMIYADTESDFETDMRALVTACKKGGLLTINGDSVSRSIDVRNASMSPDWKRYQAVKTVSIDFECAFPYWEDSAFTDEVTVVAGDDTFDVDASGSDDIMMPVITIEADQGVDVPGIKLKNLDDGGMYFEYNNPLFTAGAILEIDSEMGTITMNGNDAREYLVSGSAYLRLQSMINGFTYEGAACTITVSFKKVYA
jgi:hypothetical protein